MADVFLFMRHGWKNIWKQKTIWLFSALPILDQLFRIFQIKRGTDLLSSFIWLVISFALIVLFYVSYIGVPYLAYCFLIGKSVTIQETLSAVKKFAGRVIGCSCLGFLALSPLLFWVLAISINSSTRTLELSNKTILALLPLSIFTALWQFTLVAFFENDWGIRQSLDRAWNLFKGHFGVLAILGLILTIVFKVYSAMSGTLTILIQSGFDATSINDLNMFNPSASLSKNVLFVLINGIGETILTTLSASVFISAYLKYSDVKLPFLMRVK
jgi:hypothetical protein